MFSRGRDAVLSRNLMHLSRLVEEGMKNTTNLTKAKLRA